MRITKQEWSNLKALEDKDVVVVVGLPGSGKSTLFKNYYKDTHKILDSFLTTPGYIDKVKSWADQGKKCILTDILLCQPKFLNEFIDTLSTSLKTAKIGVIYFENDPHKCAKNIIKRSLERHDHYITLNNRKVLVGAIKNKKPQWELEIQNLFNIYPEYIIPPGSPVIEIQCT